MEAPKHTPGPWSVEKLNDGEPGDIAIIGNKGNGGLNGTIVTRTTSMGGAIALANVRLIAAAPDMYEALGLALDAMQGLMDAVGYSDGDQDDDLAALDAVRAALELARG